MWNTPDDNLLLFFLFFSLPVKWAKDLQFWDCVRYAFLFHFKTYAKRLPLTFKFPFNYRNTSIEIICVVIDLRNDSHKSVCFIYFFFLLFARQCHTEKSQFFLEFKKTKKRSTDCRKFIELSIQKKKYIKIKTLKLNHFNLN